jgi:hypothetical protein
MEVAAEPGERGHNEWRVVRLARRGRGAGGRRKAPGGRSEVVAEPGERGVREGGDGARAARCE